MPAPQNIIAVIFDFDDTLTDDSTTTLLHAHGIDTNGFWTNRVKTLVDEGWNPTLAYLKLILDDVGDGKPLGNLRNRNLQEFGAKLRFYPGLPGLFGDLRKIVEQHEISRPTVEFYVISGGLEEIIRGSKIAPYMTEIWGCRFAEEPKGKRISHVMDAVTFTEKTKHLFVINKGLVEESKKNPFAVNEDRDETSRRIPFRNMLYVGDGLSDVPCFSLLRVSGGCSFGVFDPKKEESPKFAWQKLILPQRVTSLNAPKYRKTDDLGSLIHAAVEEICLQIDRRSRAP